MPKGYDYGNARLRAMRSRLLTEEDYGALLAKADIKELISALTETPYQPDLESALLRAEGRLCILEAVRSNLTRTLRQVNGFFEDEPLMLFNLLLRRFDRDNLLAIMRGQKKEIAPDTVLSAVVPVGQLDEVSLRELSRQPGLRAAIDLMTTWRMPYASVLRKLQAAFDQLINLDQLELAINRFHYASLAKALEPGNENRSIVHEHIKTEIDLLNILTTLRLARIPGAATLIGQRYRAQDIRPLLIDVPAYVQVKRLSELVAGGEGPEGIVRALSDTRYGPALNAGWQRYQSTGEGLSALERELERWQAKQAAAMFTHQPLSIAIPIGYMGLKEVEIANLRLIAQAVALGMPQEQVRRDLIIL